MHFLDFCGIGDAVGGADDIEVMEMACAGAPLTEQVAEALRLQGISRLRRPAAIGFQQYILHIIDELRHACGIFLLASHHCLSNPQRGMMIVPD